MSNTDKLNQRIIKVSKEQLPLCCPQPEDDVWNMHPRVYLELETSSKEQMAKAICPYCSTQYILQD